VECKHTFLPSISYAFDEANHNCRSRSSSQSRKTEKGFAHWVDRTHSRPANRIPNRNLHAAIGKIDAVDLNIDDVPHRICKFSRAIATARRIHRGDALRDIQAQSNLRTQCEGCIRSENPCMAKRNADKSEWLQVRGGACQMMFNSQRLSAAARHWPHRRAQRAAGKPC
jgi:hypothetical protein